MDPHLNVGRQLRETHRHSSRRLVHFRGRTRSETRLSTIPRRRDVTELKNGAFRWWVPKSLALNEPTCCAIFCQPNAVSRIPRRGNSRGVAQPGLARQTGGLKVAGSNPVAPTILNFEPFRENVEGLSLFFDETYVAQCTVQTNGIKDLSPDRIV